MRFDLAVECAKCGSGNLEYQPGEEYELEFKCNTCNEKSDIKETWYEIIKSDATYSIE